ncbi:hypothetical protein D3C84_424450 [compost metagenome]
MSKSPSPVINLENSSNEAISVVQAPDKPSFIFFISSGGAIPCNGSITLSRYSSAEASGLILMVNRFFKFVCCFILSLTSVCNTSSKLDAGSVLIKRTFFPLSASFIAVAQARDVLPTPPFPVKNKYFVYSFSMMLFWD